MNIFLFSATLQIKVEVIKNRDCKKYFTDLSENEICVICQSPPVDGFTPGTLLGLV